MFLYFYQKVSVFPNKPGLPFCFFVGFTIFVS